MAAEIAQFNASLIVRENRVLALEEHLFARWTTGGLRRDRLVMGAPGSWTLIPPAGAQAMLLEIPGMTGCTLKGVAGDTGIAIAPSANPINLPVILPLGDSPVIYLDCPDGGEAIVTWL